MSNFNAKPYSMLDARERHRGALVPGFLAVVAFVEAPGVASMIFFIAVPALGSPGPSIMRFRLMTEVV